MDNSVKAHIKGLFSLHRAWRLVWTATPRWSLANLLLFVVQTLLPLLALLLLKQIIDSLGVALLEESDAAALQVVLWVGLAGLVALATALINSFSAYVSEAQSLAVSDFVADLIHEKSIAVDLGYYEDPIYHDTLHLAQQDALSRPASIVNGLQQTLQNLLILLGIVGLLFTFHWAVGLALLMAALPAGLVRLIYAHRLYAFERDRAELERQAWFYHWMMTSIDFAREIRLLGIGDLFRRRYRDLRETLREGRLGISKDRVRRDILAQFLAEAVVISLFGGLLGVLLGFGIAWDVATFSEWNTIVTGFSILLSFGFSVAVGLIFGTYPALNAARLDPIEALRYE